MYTIGQTWSGPIKVGSPLVNSLIRSENGRFQNKRRFKRKRNRENDKNNAKLIESLGQGK